MQLGTSSEPALIRANRKRREPGWRAGHSVRVGDGWRYWNNPVDRKAHGGVAFVPWYLRQFADYEERTGVRRLDILDLHAYIAPAGIEFSGSGDAH